MRLPVRPPFPLGPPTWPNQVPRPPLEKKTGIDYDTSWSKRYPARLARAVIIDDITRPLVHLLASPRVYGLDRIAHLESPAIFAANHHSHLDTPLLLTSLPERFRHRAMVAAAADYFFSNPAKSVFSVLTIGAFPIERIRLNRRSGDLAAELLEDGWSIVIFPEGGRTPDGWAQEFRGGAAYLSIRTGRPLVPAHISGTRRILKKGDTFPTPVGRFGFGKEPGVRVTFGTPLRADEGENANRLGLRLERVIAALADEATTDWWTARRRAAEATTPALSGPQAGAWRRSWALKENVRTSSSAGPEWP